MCLGDTWTDRYKSLKLQTPKDMSELPFGRWFTKDMSYNVSTEELTRTYREYAGACNLNIWCSATVESATWQEETRTWDVLVMSGGKQHKVTCRHAVFSIGGLGQEAKMAEYPDRKSFPGTTLHSMSWSSGES